MKDFWCYFPIPVDGEHLSAMQSGPSSSSEVVEASHTAAHLWQRSRAPC